MESATTAQIFSFFPMKILLLVLPILSLPVSDSREGNHLLGHDVSSYGALNSQQYSDPLYSPKEHLESFQETSKRRTSLRRIAMGGLIGALAGGGVGGVLTSIQSYRSLQEHDDSHLDERLPMSHTVILRENLLDPNWLGELAISHKHRKLVYYLRPESKTGRIAVISEETGKSEVIASGNADSEQYRISVGGTERAIMRPKFTLHGRAWDVMLLHEAAEWQVTQYSGVVLVSNDGRTVARMSCPEYDWSWKLEIVDFCQEPDEIFYVILGRVYFVSILRQAEKAVQLQKNEKPLN